MLYHVQDLDKVSTGLVKPRQVLLKNALCIHRGDIKYS